MPEIRSLVRRFRYRKDSGRDRWRFLLAKQGPLEGDCEDFSLTAAFFLARGSWTQFWIDAFLGRSVVWFCTTSSGEQHAMLYRRGEGWIDNIHPTWSSTPRHRRWFPYYGPLLALKLLVS